MVVFDGLSLDKCFVVDVIQGGSFMTPESQMCCVVGACLLCCTSGITPSQTLVQASRLMLVVSAIAA